MTHRQYVEEICRLETYIGNIHWKHVSNQRFVFPISNHCFQSTNLVSNLFWCFQCMFPVNILPGKISYFISLSNFESLTPLQIMAPKTMNAMMTTTTDNIWTIELVSIWIVLFTENKVGCVVSMVIWSEFRMGQYRDDDHREYAPQCIIIGKFLGNELDRINGKLIQSSIGEFLGMKQAVLLTAPPRLSI